MGQSLYTPSPGATGNINRIANGGMLLCNGTETVSDAGIAFVSYRILTQAGDVSVSQLTTPEAGQSRAMRITQSQASAQRIGVSQAIAAIDCQDLRSALVNTQHRCRLSVSGRTMFALLEWTGVADTQPTDVINDWTNTNYIPGAFFVSTVRVINYGYLSAQIATWESAPYIPFQVGTTANNLIYVIWTESEIAQNVTLDVGLVQVADGVTPQQFEHRTKAIEEVVSNPSLLTEFFATYTAMTASPYLVDSTVYCTSARTAEDDGGFGFWRYDAAATDAANGGTILAVDGGGAGRFFRLYTLPADVRWFGAKIDGATDDKAAIEAALTAVNWISILDGTALVTGIVIPSGNKRISGAGRGDTIIKLKNASNAHTVSATDFSDIQIENLTIDGNKANQSTGAGNNWRGLYALGECHRWRIENVEVKNAVDHGFMGSDGGVPADETWKYSVFENCVANNCGSAAHTSGGGTGGSGFNGGSKTTKWCNCFSHDNYLSGFKANGTFEFCDAVNNGSNFVIASGTPAQSSIAFIGCRALGGTGDGFRLESPSDDVMIQSCVANGHAQSGITVINDVEHLQILGCRIYNNGAGGTRTATNGLDAITVLQTSGDGPKKILIDDCLLFDDQGGSSTQDYGVYIDDPSTDLIITANNVIQNNQLGPLIMSATAKNDNVRIGAFTGSTNNYRDLTPVAVTGTTSTTDLMSRTLKADEQFNGSITIIRGRGTITGTAGTKTVRYDINGSGRIMSNQSAGETQDWSVELRVTRTGTSLEVCGVAYEEGGTSAVTYDTFSISLATDIVVKLTGQLGDSADTITQTMMSVTRQF